MNGNGSFVVTSLFCAMLSTLVGFGAYKCAKIESRERFLPRIEALDEERQELARQVAELEKMRIKDVTVTAYSPSSSQCDSDPHVTASMVRVRPGIVAVSRDLFEQGWVFGKKVYVKGHGIFEIADLMNKRHTQRMDIFFPDTEAARRFGVKQVQVALLAG